MNSMKSRVNKFLASSWPWVALVLVVVLALLIAVWLRSVDFFDNEIPGDRTQHRGVFCDAPAGKSCYKTVDFELAGNAVIVDYMLMTIDVAKLRTSLYHDFVFIVGFSLFFAGLNGLGVMCAEKVFEVDPDTWLLSLGAWAWRLIWVAGFFDAIENIALLRVLKIYEAMGMYGFWPGLARWMAILKFGLITFVALTLIGLLVLNLALGVRWLFFKFRKKGKEQAA